MKKPLLFLSVAAGLFFSIQTVSAQWTKLNLGVTDTVVAMAATTGNIYAVTHGGALYQSSDQGMTWGQESITGFGLDTAKVTCLATDQGIIVAGANDGVLLYQDGQGWINETYQGTYGNFYVTSIAISGNNIYAGTKIGSVIYSTDMGFTWYQTNTKTSSSVNAIYLSADGLFIGTTEGAFLSIDSCQTITNVSTGLESHIGGTFSTYGVTSFYEGNKDFAGTANGGGVFAFVTDSMQWDSFNAGLGKVNGNYYPVNSLAADGQIVCAGTGGGGVYVLTSKNTWNAANAGLTDMTIISMVSNYNYLFAGTPSGVWRISRTSLSGSGVSEYEPSTAVFSLSQNYPNPFNGETTIHVSLPDNDASNASLRVYNMLGEEVGDLTNQLQQAGQLRQTSDIIFNSTNLTAGAYYYALETKSGRMTREMFVVR